MIESITLTIPATDGYPLSAIVLEPSGQPRGVVQFHRGTLTPKEFYLPFCRFLAEQGFVVVAFDYRGMGGSRPKTLKGFDGSIVDWGRKDMAGVLSWIRRTYADQPTFVVGHSMGGQLVGLMKNCRHLDGVLTVASNYGSWKYYSGLNRWKSALIWATYFPAALWSCGYLPLERLGMGEDLPREAAWDLWRWCCGRGTLNRLLERAGFQHFFDQVRCPVKAVYLTDDNIASRGAISIYRRDYASARLDVEVIEPAELGVSRLGHYGFFKAQHQDSLWSPVAKWLRQQVPVSVSVHPDVRREIPAAPFLDKNRAQPQPLPLRAH